MNTRSRSGQDDRLIRGGHDAGVPWRDTDVER